MRKKNTPTGQSAAIQKSKTAQIFSLAHSLARAVDQFSLPIDLAEASLTAVIYRYARLGKIDADPADLLKTCTQILNASISHK